MCAVALAVTVSATTPSVAAATLHLGGMRLNGSVRVEDAVRFNDGAPYRGPLVAARLESKTDFRDLLRLVANIEGGYDGKVRNPKSKSPILNLRDVYQDKDWFLDFDELYLDAALLSWDVRVGKQKISWGRLDEIQPTDNFNPEDLTEFLIPPELERKIGVPAAKVAYNGDTWTLEGVWVPFSVPYRLANERDRWFFPLLRVDPELHLSEVDVGGARLDDVLVNVTTSYPDIDLPARTLRNSEWGTRLSFRLFDADLSISYFRGLDKVPTFAAGGDVLFAPTPGASQPLAIDADLRIAPSAHRISVFGADFTTVLSVFGLRGEIAYIQDRAFNRDIRSEIIGAGKIPESLIEAALKALRENRPVRAPLALPEMEVQSDAVQYGIGIDYSFSGDVSQALIRSNLLTDLIVSPQMIQTWIIDHQRGLIADKLETLFTATLRKTFGDGRWSCETRAGLSVGGPDFVFWPVVRHKLTEHLDVSAALRIFAGQPDRPLGQFREHDEAQAEIRYRF